MGDRLISGLFRLASRVVVWIPPRAAYRLAGAVGWLLYALAPRLRRAVLDNVRHVIGPATSPAHVRRHAREVCTNLIKSHYDLFRVGRLKPHEIKSLIRVEGAERVGEFIARGQGVILAAPHLGNVDVVMQLPMIYGWPATAVVQHIRPEGVFRQAFRLRTSHGLKMIPSDGPMLALFRALRRGEIVGLACDRDVTDSARRVPFFGAPAWLPDGPVQVALRTNAPLITGFALRLHDDSFAVHIDPPVPLPRTGDREADVDAGMALVVARMEHWIGQHPGQWLVSAPIWREERAPRG